MRKSLEKSLAKAARLLDAGDAALALPLIEAALGQDGVNPQAHHLAARFCRANGQIDTAFAHAKRAVDLAPENPVFLDDIGRVLQAAGRNGEAASAFQAALARDPEFPGAWARLGFTFRNLGDLGGALGAFGRAVQADDTDVNAYLGWVDLLGRATTPGFDAAIADELLRALTGPLSAPEELAPAIAQQLRHKYAIADGAATDAPPPALDAADPLLAAYLGRCLNIDPAIELALTAHRRRLLAADAWTPEDAALARLIALQGFTGEYAMFATDEETAMLDAHAAAATDPHALLAFAMYRPLIDFPAAARLADEGAWRDDPLLADVVRLTLSDPLAERRLRDAIPALTEIADETSQKVRAQYEEHPYPRWTAPTPQAAVNPAAMLSGMFRHFEPPAFLDDKLRVLIAGCGTGRHTAAVAQAFPKAAITAIDLSRASIAYGMRMLDERGIGANVKMIQADILDAGRLDGPFDMIQSVGVLHHMAEPIAGWRVLAGLLRPGGVMKIGLYSERGRRGVLKCRDIIAKEGIGSTDADMRAFRRRLIAERPGGDFEKILERADFYSLSMCRDLLFHVQEVCYTPARIADELAELGLDFIGFEEVEALGLAAQYRDKFPGDPAMTDLGNWETLEAALDDPPEGYVFWCRRPDT